MQQSLRDQSIHIDKPELVTGIEKYARDGIAFNIQRRRMKDCRNHIKDFTANDEKDTTDGKHARWGGVPHACEIDDEKECHA